MKKKLLVIADKNRGKNYALLRAVELQQHTGASITLMGFCYANIDHIEDLELSKLSRKSLEKRMVQQRRDELKSVVQQMAPDANINLEVLWGKTISPAVNAACEKHRIDLVLKSANRSEGILYTSTDWQLIRECPAPVLISANKSWKKQANILAAVDFATKKTTKIKLNHQIVTQAKELADTLGHELHIVYALTLPEALVDMDLINPKTYTQTKKQKLKPVIDEFAEQYGLTKEQIHIKTGKADKVIPSIANKLKADLVVTGTVGRKGIKGKLLGNTAESILSKLHTDIIAIKP